MISIPRSCRSWIRIAVTSASVCALLSAPCCCLADPDLTNSPTSPTPAATAPLENMPVTPLPVQTIPSTSPSTPANPTPAPVTPPSPSTPATPPPTTPAPSAPTLQLGSTGTYVGSTSAAIPAHGWIIDGDLDARYRTATSGRSNEIYLNEGELDISHSFYTNDEYKGNVFIQAVGENQPDASGGKGQYSDVELGEAYVSYRLPVQTATGSSAYLRFGQFILPVGLLPVYDTHLNILQTLAPEALGLRVDYGLMLEGEFNGIYNYRFSVTSGTGADKIILIPDRVAAFRLGRLFSTSYGVFNFGGSVMEGRLPVTEVDPLTGFPPILSPSGYIRPTYGFIDKSRIVGDGQWAYRALTVRGEVMTGADDNTQVGGYFLMGEYRFAPGLDAVIGSTYWDYGKNSSKTTDTAVGLDITYGPHLVVRTLYEEQYDDPYQSSGMPDVTMTHLRHVFTVQVVARF